MAGLEAQEVAVRVRLLGGAAFKAEADGVSRSVQGIGAAGKRADISGPIGRSAGALTNLGSKMSNVGSKMIGVGKTMTTAGLPIAALGYYAVRSSAQFSQAMTLLSTQAGLPQKNLAALSKQVEDMAPKFGATPKALADALYPIESIQLRGPAALNALKAAAMGSAVGLDSLSNTADAVTTVMASKIKGSGSPVEAMSIMDKAIGLGKMHLMDLTESFKSGIIPVATKAGVGFKSLLAAVSGLTRIGVPANMAMSRMRLTLTSMISPTSMGIKALSKLGMTQFQLADDLKRPNGLNLAIQDLKMHMDAVGNTDLSNSYMAQIFGKSRGIASIGSLLQQLPQIQGIYGQLTGTTSATLTGHMAQTRQTAAFKYKQIQAALDTAMIHLGDAINRYLLPALAQLVPAITGAVKWFGQLPGGVKKFLLILLSAVVVGGPLLMFTGALVKTTGAILKTIAWIGRLGTASEAAAGAQGAGGLAGFAKGLARVIPLLALFAVALAVRKRVVPAVNRTVQHALHPGRATQQDLRSGGGSYDLGPFGGGRLPFGGGDGGLNFLGIHIPWLADGGMATHAGLAVVGERGPELLSLPRGATVTPNIGPSNALPSLSDTKFPGSVGGGDQTIVTHTQLVLDGKVLTRTVNTENRKAQNRR
jgi:TP901 family phage tail tape measure protein